MHWLHLTFVYEFPVEFPACDQQCLSGYFSERCKVPGQIPVWKTGLLLCGPWQHSRQGTAAGHTDVFNGRTHGGRPYQHWLRLCFLFRWSSTGQSLWRKILGRSDWLRETRSVTNAQKNEIIITDHTWGWRRHTFTRSVKTTIDGLDAKENRRVWRAAALRHKTLLKSFWSFLKISVLRMS